MHCLAQGLRKVLVEPGVMATQNFKRNLLLNLCREGKKYDTFVSSCCLREREKNVRHLHPIPSVWRPLAFPPVTLSGPLGSNTQADPNVHVE